MVVVGPLVGDRVAPRCTTANGLLLVTSSRRSITHQLPGMTLVSVAGLLETVHLYSVDVLVCGGMTTEAREQVASLGVTVVSNAAGSVEELLEAIAAGVPLTQLGLGDSLSNDERVVAVPDCLACAGRPGSSGSTGRLCGASSRRAEREASLQAQGLQRERSPVSRSSAKTVARGQSGRMISNSHDQLLPVTKSRPVPRSYAMPLRTSAPGPALDRRGPRST